MLFYLCVEDFFLLTPVRGRHILVAVNAICLVQESMSALALAALAAGVLEKSERCTERCAV